MGKYLFFLGNPNLLSKINNYDELGSYCNLKLEKSSQKVSKNF